VRLRYSATALPCRRAARPRCARGKPDGRRQAGCPGRRPGARRFDRDLARVTLQAAHCHSSRSTTPRSFSSPKPILSSRRRRWTACFDDSTDFVQDLRSMASCPACSPMRGVGANEAMASAVGSTFRVGRRRHMLREVVPRFALITVQDPGCEFRRMGERRSSASELPVWPAVLPNRPAVTVRAASVSTPVLSRCVCRLGPVRNALGD
jgi:hypothetical protein